MSDTKQKKPVTFKTYEEYEIGEKIALGSYLLEPQEIIDYAKKWDPMPAHTDEQAAKRSVFGGLTASGSHMAAIRIHMIQKVGVNPHVIAALGWDKVRFLKPGRSGDTLHLVYECIEKRRSNSKPDCGIVTLFFEMTNQDDELVFSMTDTILVQMQNR